MNNNKNYQEITAKRKATILKKREAKQAKKEAILDRLNNDIDYLNKVRKAVEKRSDTISKKQFIKDLFNAGSAYVEEKKKIIPTNSSQTEREVKKGERSALGGKFKVVKYYDNLDLLLYAEQMGMRIIVPNEPVIKNFIDTSLRKQIAENNSKEKLKCFITIKYNVCEVKPKNCNLINEGL